MDVVLQPAPPDHGIVFYRSDVDVFIPAVAEEAAKLEYATSLGPKGSEVSTIEHFMAAAYALGVDNLLVEVNGPELPVLDGSAAPWVAALQAAGTIRQPREVIPIAALRPLTITGSQGRRLEIRPARELRVTYTIEFPHAAIGRQSFTAVISPESFIRHIAPARTFGFLSEYEQLKAAGLARGASLSNCVVIGPEKVENGPLRFPDEFVRHKALDLVGDLALLGRPLLGHVIAFRAGHAMHVQLARTLRDEAFSAGVTQAQSVPGSR